METKKITTRMIVAQMIYFSMCAQNQVTKHPKAVQRLSITELKSGATKKADT